MKKTNERTRRVRRKSGSQTPAFTSRVVRPRRIQQKPQSTETPLRIIPLGGMREIGKNMTVFEYKDSMIIVDCGIAFPEEDMPGVDVIIPDFTYIRENKHKLQGIFITHGHEDHIGALPWFLEEFDVPVYGTPMTLKLIRMKLEDRRKKVAKKADLRLLKAGESVRRGVFTISFIHVNHSIADAVALAIRTPVGTVVHTGDFKIDYTPTSGDVIDLGTFAKLGEEGVLLMLGESTNAEREGHSMTEAGVGAAFTEIFANAPGRVIVTTFSSNVFRLQQVISKAEEFKRKVLILGRSMLNVFTAANELGYLTFEPGTVIDLNELDRYAPEEIVLLTTGSQGEPMSALTRLAFSEHRSTEIIEGDTVVLSSSMIPGNERAINRVIDALFRKGARVIYQSLADVHASGHAYREELKLIYELVKPTFFIPCHGEFRMLYRHAELVAELGHPKSRTALLGNGEILELTSDKMSFKGFTEGAGILIDGSGMGDIDELVLRDRLLLAEDGVVTVFITVDTQNNRIMGEPDIQAKGFIYASEMKHMVDICREKIADISEKLLERNKPLAKTLNTNDIRNQLQKRLYQYTKRRPVIIVSVNAV